MNIHPTTSYLQPSYLQPPQGNPATDGRGSQAIVNLAGHQPGDEAREIFLSEVKEQYRQIANALEGLNNLGGDSAEGRPIRKDVFDFSMALAERCQSRATAQIFLGDSTHAECLDEADRLLKEDNLFGALDHLYGKVINGPENSNILHRFSQLLGRLGEEIYPIQIYVNLKNVALNAVFNAGPHQEALFSALSKRRDGLQRLIEVGGRWQKIIAGVESKNGRSKEVDALLASGDQAYKDKQFAEAIDNYSAALDQDPEDTQALGELIRAADDWLSATDAELEKALAPTRAYFKHRDALVMELSG